MTAKTEPTQLSPLKQAFLALEELQAKLDAVEAAKHEPIAIVGIGCRFPGGADNPEMFWKLLRDGVDAVAEIPPDRWDVETYYDADPDAPGKSAVRVGAFIQQPVDHFDPQFFGIAPREAASMDPQQRLLLEVSWEALEHAGIAPDTLSGSATGVFVALAASDYLQLYLKANDPTLLDAYYASGVAHSIASGRLSYVLGLQGPSMTVDTACSSSLVAVHLAVQSLRSGECRMALAGGANLILSPENHVAFSKYGMLANDGRCKTFDAAADGFARGEGCGMIVMKRLSVAEADGDRLLAVIRGSAVNQDGPSSGLTAPNGPSQQAVIRAALADAQVLPHQVSYIEAHGTGTSLGDPIEVQALGVVLCADRSVDNPLAIGSVKTNIGHLEAASGIAGLIKAVLALQHREIPAHLHFHDPSPHIPWNKLPIVVPTEHIPWYGVEGRLIAGVSSFGFSGTNVHTILEAVPLSEKLEGEPFESLLHLVTLSARGEAALKELASRMDSYLDVDPHVSLTDVSYTANAGRAHFSHRLAIAANSNEELRQKLQAFLAGQDAAGVTVGTAERTDKPKIAFLFTGQGAQYVQMGRQLYETQPIFRAALDRCAEILGDYLERPLLSVLYPEADGSSPLDDTAYTQPALFAIEYALAELWRSWGIEPSAVMGHSVGEYVAACIAGVFSLEDGLKLIAARGRLMSCLPSGGVMAAIFADEMRVTEAIVPSADSVSIAAINGPDNIVISGDGAVVQKIQDTLKAQGIKSKRLTVSHAFHSPLMEPILTEFEREAASIKLNTPRIRLFSNVTGMAASQEVTSPDYWRKHIRQPVQFAKTIDSLHGQGYEIFLEIGPSPTLIGMGQRCLADAEDPGLWLPSLRSGRDDWGQMFASLAALYVHGAAVDWEGLYHEHPRQKLALPTYPFQRSRYWMPQPKTKRQAAHSQEGTHPLLGTRLRSPLKTIQFETFLSADELPFLNDHRIYGTALLPATGFIEMATAAARALFSGMAVVQDVVIHDALVVGEAGCSVQLIVTPEGDQQGSFEVFSQDGDEWKLHASGIIADEPADAPLPVSLESIRERCTEAVTREAHYAHLGDNGLNFGDSLRGVSEVWRKDGEALGLIRLPQETVTEMGQYHIHPALLDACLQVAAHAMPISADVYLPLSFDRFRLNRAPDTQVWGYVRLESAEAGRETFGGDVQVLDDAGSVIAEIRGLRFKRAGQDTLLNLSGVSIDDWLYEVAWRPLENFAQDAQHDDEGKLPAPVNLSETLHGELEKLASQHDLPMYISEILPELRELSANYVIQAFQKLGWKPRLGEQFSSEALADRLGVVQQHRRLFGRLLEILEEAGIVSREGSEWKVINEPAVTQDPQSHAAALLQQYPAYAEIEIAERCGSQFAEALIGKADPLQLLFPDGGTNTAERLYHDAPGARVYNGLMGQAVAAVVAELPADRTLRILEIGAGTGGTTGYALPVLPADRTSYLFTDISPLFVAKAEQKFAQYDFARFQSLDIERDPSTQGLSGQQFDIIIASNVIHATTDLRQTLAHVRQLLAPNGLLMMLEVTAPESWVDISFGLTDGWWRFVDRDLRESYPLLTSEQWIDLLGQMGFGEAAAIPENRTNYVEQAIIIARNSETTGQWLIFADSEGVGQSLAKNLEDRGQQYSLVVPGDSFAEFGERCWQINPAEVADYQTILNQSAANIPLRGVVHLWSLDIPADSLDWSQSLGYGSVLNLVKALAGSGESPRMWLVTSGAQAVNGDGQPLSVAQSPLWGLGKVIALEHPELRAVRVDLDLAANGDSGSALFEAVWSGGKEDQIAYRNGGWYGARLIRSKAVKPLVAHQPVQLQITQRGTLDNLVLQPVARQQPGVGEVEIRVYATALNFKDVMNALGMYPGDPGPIGGECAGVVTAVGAGVDGLKVGDEVVALASGCFSTYAIADVRLAVPKPQHLTFEEAVTIPIPFITAYFTLHYLGQMAAGDKVLIHAAAGGVGLAAVQLALRAGAEVYATAGSEEKREFLRTLGVPHVMDSRSLDFADEIKQITGGRGVDLVLNSLAGEFIPKSLSVLADHGRFLEIGKSGLLTDEQAAALGQGIQYFIVDWTETARENPLLIRDMLLNILDAVESGSLQPLPYRTFTLRETVSAFRYMAAAKHTGKIVITQETASFVRPDATYLITGGLSGLGLLTAEWLVEKGVRHLALMGRRSVNDSAREAIARMESAGAQVAVMQGDVSQERDVTQVLEAIQETMPPLRGIIHSAGVLDDGALVQQDWSRFATVFGPKVDGTWLLHHLTQHLPLDFFVMYSSIASLLGSAGQGNHAAANAFMDVLASHRRMQGLAGLTINWGAWSEVGAAVEHNVFERIGLQGVGAIPPADGLRVLERLLQGETAQVGVTPVTWPLFMRQFLPGTEPAFLTEVMREARQTIVSDGARKTEAVTQPDILRQIAEANPARQRALLTAYVREHAARVLELGSPEALSERVPLNEMGLDSLMAVELRNRLGTGLGLKRSLPATLVFDYPTVEAIAQYLAREALALDVPQEEQMPEAPASGKAVSNLLDELEDLSDEEIDRLLSQKAKRE